MRKFIVALSCMLFVATYAQAQSPDEESLSGLKGVRLVVMFGRAEALEKEQRPAVLKLLQNDAEAKLARAGIPLLKTTTDMENAPGSPQLFVTVTLDKPNGHVFPVVSRTRLLQKARLTQNPSLELEVSTWETHSIGDYEITNLEMMRQQVGNEIDMFIKAYLAANPK